MDYSRSTSPLPLPANHSRDCMSAATKRWKYLRRMFKFNQMDFEFAFWQMLYLFVSPQKIFRNFQHRKQTKSQYARDDPAFLVLLAVWLCVTSIGFALLLGLTFGNFIMFLFYIIFVDCIFTGVIIATIFWFVLNKYCRLNEDQDVEWGFAFDVHLNALFPPLVILHFCQLLLHNGLISHQLVISRFIGNTFWLVAMSYYIYITFLGYSSLQILRRTQFLLVPLPLILLFYFLSLAGGFNITHALMYFYKHRVV